MGSYHKRMVALCLWMILLSWHLGSYVSTAVVQRDIGRFRSSRFEVLTDKGPREIIISDTDGFCRSIFDL